MTDFDQLNHVAQLPLLLELAVMATKLYALPADLVVKMINLSENATYSVTAPNGQRWALRIHRGGYHSHTAIASELAWLQDLRSSGVTITPRPIAGRNGEIIQLAKHPRMPDPRHVVLSEWEQGIEPQIGANLTKPMEALGEVAAKMHHHSRTWQRPAWFTRPVWNFDTALGQNPHWGRWRDGMGVDAPTAALFDRTVDLIERRLTAYGQNDARFGLIHCDLRLANLLIDGDQVKVIDFDDCGFSWFMYDAATPISFYEHQPQAADLIEAWKTGYRRVLHLTAADEAEIPTFVMLRRLLLVAWIGSHHETDLAQSMGLEYTKGSLNLCENYLSVFG
jgi:Ser/Thr protein kinase RdoA (MazF antagonist)